MTDSKQQAEPPVPSMLMWQFLMYAPPGKKVQIDDMNDGNNWPRHPEITIRCNDAKCRADMSFDCESSNGSLDYDKCFPVSFLYRCRHCKHSTKWFAFLAKRSSSLWEAIKLGEQPPFGPHTPPRVISLAGPAKDLFLKGRASEAHGLGIGAFTYYRRVVESQWQRLIDVAIKVSKRLELPSEILEQARAEQQFSKAVEMVKDAIPQALLINGHNPMTLLYKVLSEGVHDLTDDQCLERAETIRVILIDFAGRVGEALKERKEVEDALTKLFQGEDQKEISGDAESQSEEEPDGPTEEN